MKLLRLPITMRGALAILLVLVACVVMPQQVSLPSLKIGLEGAKGQNEVSTSLQILALLTVLSVAPAIMILTTAFTRIVIIFGFLRNALGTPTIPPNQVVIGLSLFLTFFIMAPTYGKINDTALKPYLKKEIKVEQAVELAQKPLREFMLKNTYEKDLLLFVNMRGEKPESRETISLLTLIPAFIISELKTAFIIGFYIFIPFLIIDLIVASGLMSMGMMMLPPVMVSLPAKVLVFILADGWTNIVSAIMQGYR
ncbi:MAG: flagellar type III secretion system pore protein FliP [Fimbriimonadaceae bacterium]